MLNTCSNFIPDPEVPGLCLNCRYRKVYHTNNSIGEENMDIKTRTTTKKSHTVELDPEAIRGLLDIAGYEVPANASITISVPGGGDWSNTELDVTDTNPIRIEWTEDG